ncbi:MAG: DUF2807 domain-containing protein [Bacteroidales bacterium]
MKARNFIVSVAVSFLCSCSLIDKWSPGETEVRTVQITNSFEDINIDNIFEITLIQDENSYVDIICGCNFQSKVDVKVEDNTLILDHSIKNRWLNGYDKVKLELHLPTLSTINIHKPIKIETVGTFKTDSFYLIDWSDYSDCNVSVEVNNLAIHTSGDSFGTYIITGKTNTSTIYGRGSAKIDCSALQTETCEYYQKSIVDASINVGNQFDVQIESSGNVYYSGSPNISLVRSGSGKLIQN